MALPGPDDYALGEIDNLAACIMGKLRIIVRGSWRSTPTGYIQTQQPTAKMYGDLCELVETYVDRVVGMAERCQAATKVEPAPAPQPRVKRRRQIERIPKRRRK
jgi:hypothetical protein